MNENKIKNSIEKQIKNNFFKSKQELYEYILKINQEQKNNLLTEKEIEQLLKLYDELNNKEEFPLDMEHYSDKKLKDNNYIVSERDDRVLKTHGNSNDFIKEFKQTQNEILAYSQNGNTNANQVFNKVADTQKEEVTLIPIHEAIERERVDKELLRKISFFIKKRQINPHAYKVDIENGIFYNNETNEMCEVRKNEETNEYEIYVSGEMKYGTNDQETNMAISNQDEQKIHEESKNKVKVRKLTYPNNAAFTNIGFLITNIISFIIASISIAAILLNK